jgi:hypothetical protein
MGYIIYNFSGLAWPDPRCDEPAAERQNEFVLAIGAFDAGKAFAKIATIEVFANDMRNDLPIKTVSLLEEIVITLLELEKVMIEKLP